MYPVFLNLNGKNCLVVGGGKVAERKVKSLLKSGAKVTVVSPEVTPDIQELFQTNQIERIAEKYSTAQIENRFLVVCSTDVSSVNEQVSRDAEERNILVNIVDKPELCSYYVPSHLQSGDLSIAISTNGKSPALAKRVRLQLEESFGSEYGELLEILGQKREELMELSSDSEKRGNVLRKIVNSDILEVLKQKGRDEAEASADGIIKESL